MTYSLGTEGTAGRSRRSCRSGLRTRRQWSTVDISRLLAAAAAVVVVVVETDENTQLNAIA